MELHERIQKIVEYSQLSIPQFSKKVGFKTPQTVRELIKGNTKTLSYQVREKILNAYPSINESWLLTGEGVMMNDITIPESAITKEPSSRNAVPIYDIDFNAGFVERYGGNELEQVGDIYSPAYRKATAVVSVTGDSMHPLISSGDQIIIREMPCTMDSIMFGKIYAVVTDNDLRTVKRIRKSSVQGCIDLEPINKEVADTTTIAFDRIISLWQVMGCIKPIN